MTESAGFSDSDAAKDAVVSRARVLLSVALDLMLLAGWLGLLALFDMVAHALPNSGHLDWLAAKWIFASATVAAILLFVYWDLRTANAALRSEYQRRFDHLGRAPETRED
ncbi:hypothetical protein [uncultured Leifsonia sp.]|uniref:hypothetical protein n=1 Tax=uncultured Leifsonia sp. TaxID=340359 RepID=UPI00262431FC|nr:hypothetical protein [uncultured Leifsonia sp.]